MSAGKASLDPPEPIRPGDLYRIASVTKAFTAAVAMQLVAEGDLSLDDTVAQIDPGLVSDGGEMTVSDLLGHTSGLADYVKDKEFAELVSNGERLTPEQVLGLVADDPLEFAPGSAYGYSDTDNIVLGLLIEQVTGNPYEEELRTRVLEPFDLTDTTLATDFDFPEPHAQGYQFDPEDDSAAPEDVTDVPIDPNGAWASGALISTPADMATFFEALLGGELVPAAQLEEMMETRPGAGSPPGPGTNNAGLGIFRWEVSCGEIWGHTGQLSGLSCARSGNRGRLRRDRDGGQRDRAPGGGRAGGAASPGAGSVLRARRAGGVAAASYLRPPLKSRLVKRDQGWARLVSNQRPLACEAACSLRSARAEIPHCQAECAAVPSRRPVHADYQGYARLPGIRAESADSARWGWRDLAGHLAPPATCRQHPKAFGHSSSAVAAERGLTVDGSRE